MITILSVGKQTNTLFEPAISNYCHRVAKLTRFELKILTHATFNDKNKVVHTESLSILDEIKDSDLVILCDENGQSITTEKLVAIINEGQVSSKNIVFIIGGAYGVSDSVKQRANLTIAYGASVFPHQLVRLMTVEQVYRAMTILHGLQYHNA